jgi:hypothetical protein
VSAVVAGIVKGRKGEKKSRAIRGRLKLVDQIKSNETANQCEIGECGGWESDDAQVLMRALRHRAAPY